MNPGLQPGNPGDRRAPVQRLKAVVQALRPKQWVKNGLVFVPLLFAVDQAWSVGNLTPLPGLLLGLLALFAGFCLMSGGIYLVNDLWDRDSDRAHPEKKLRPIASGRVSVPLAIAMALALVTVGLGLLFGLGLVLGGIGALYAVINLAYSAGCKRIALVDVMIVAGGYVLRAGAGAVAVGVAPSPWLYVVTAAAALFLVLGRRYAELRLAGDDEISRRPALASYAGPFIGQLLNISATTALVSYTLYAIEADNLPGNHTMLLTVPLFAFGLFRYLHLLNHSPEAEFPEQLLTRDPQLAAAAVGWLVVSALVLLLNG